MRRAPPMASDASRQLTASDARRQVLASIPLSERRRRLAGAATAVLEGGDGPLLVLLHGQGGCAAGWLPILPDLVRTAASGRKQTHAGNLRRPDPLGPGRPRRHRRRSAFAGRPAIPSHRRHPDRCAAAVRRSPAPPGGRWLRVQRPLPPRGGARGPADRRTRRCHRRLPRGGADRLHGVTYQVAVSGAASQEQLRALVLEVDRIASIPDVLRRETAVSLSDVKVATAREAPRAGEPGSSVTIHLPLRRRFPRAFAHHAPEAPLGTTLLVTVLNAAAERLARRIRF
jgi:hypothetical protein